MSVSFNKAAIAAAASLAALVLTNAALAAVSLGYPQGRPYYGSQNQRSTSRSYNNYAPSYSMPTETRQSFSYEPSESGDAGEHVVAAGGCCCGGHVVQSGESKDAVAANPNETRRSYSYEPDTQPAPRMRTYNRRSMAVREPWQYQKTDPRRMGR